MCYKPACASLVVALFLLAQVSAQSSFDCIPKDAIAAVRVNHIGGLASRAQSFLQSALQDEQIQDIFCKQPFPLLLEEQFIQVSLSIELLLDQLEDTNSLTIYFTSLSPKIEYCLILEVAQDFDSAKKKELEKLMTDSGNWPMLGNGRLTNSDQEADTQETDFDLALSSQKLLTELVPSYVRKVGNRFVISNSKIFGTWTSIALERKDAKPDKSSITRNRRFQRAVALLKKPLDADVFVFLVPTKVLPYIDKKYDEQLLETYGVKELVGAAGKMVFGPPNPYSAFGDVHLKVIVPFTLPRQGLSKHWESLKPLKDVVDIVELFSEGDDDPERITLISRDREMYLDSLERSYLEHDDPDGFKKLLEREIRRAGSLNVYKKYFDGTHFLFTTCALEDDASRKSVRFFKIADYESTLKYVRNYVESENKELTFKYEEIEIDGNRGWFLSDENNLKQAESEVERKLFENEKEYLVNNGFFATKNWLIHGDKSTISEFVNQALVILSSVDSVIEEVIPGAGKIVRDSQPGWVELTAIGFRRKVILTGLRIGHYSKRTKLIWTLTVDDESPIESRSDRVFAVYYQLASRILNQYPKDMRTFSNLENRVEFNWLFQSTKPAQ